MMGRFRIIMHCYAVSIKTCFYETSNVFYLEYEIDVLLDDLESSIKINISSH